ncbi:MAG: hypothetical protein FWC43_04755 [Planctomycetaceae bacterium]|nr:hypothetical protein [Planctomycetaceae bacterium]
MKSSELQQWSTMKSLDGVKASYRTKENLDSFDIVVVPRGARQTRYGFGGMSLSQDSRIFVILKSDIPEPRPGDTIELGDETYDVSALDGVPCWIPYGRYGLLIKVHAKLKTWKDD